MPDAMAETEWIAPFAIDVRRTLSVQGRGRGDPTFQADETGAIWRTSLTPDGPATIRVLPARLVAQPASGQVPQPLQAQTPQAELAQADSKRTKLVRAQRLQAELPQAARVAQAATEMTKGEYSFPGTGGERARHGTQEATPALVTRVRAQAWGPGARWLLDALPAVLGLYDDISGFAPETHPVIKDAARRYPDLRLGRSGRLMEALVPAILEQKVVVLEAHRAWRILLSRYGTSPPGPAPHGMRVFPDPKTWRRIPSWDWHLAGVEGVRAETIIRAASVADSLERLLTLTHEEADRKLRTIPGIGVWTSAEARQRAAGDPDAVSVGDYHLKNVVGWALAGRRRSTDEEMLALLEPFKGHRHRVTRLIGLSRGNAAGGAARPGTGISRYGSGGPPRRGPRMPVRDYRNF